MNFIQIKNNKPNEASNLYGRLSKIKQSIMKKTTLKTAILATIALFGWSISSSSQVTLIYPDATPNASFTTIKAAYDSIYFANHAGAHIIQLESSYVPSGETYPITLGVKTGASATNAVTIKPATGVKVILSPLNKTVIYSNLTFASAATTLTVPSTTGVVAGMAVYGFGFNFYSTPYRYSTVSSIDAVNNTITVSDAASAASTAGRKIFVGTPGTQTVVFDGAKYVTIDGISRTGATGLEIVNPNSINCQTIYFKNNAQYNTVQNCIVRGANISGNVNNGTAGTIYFGGGQYNTITNNDVCDMGDANIPYPICAFQMAAGGGTNAYNKISSNNICNIANLHSPNGPCTFMQFGSEGAAAGNEVLDNKFFWTNDATFSATAINFFNCGTLGLGQKFEGNTIGYTSANGTGTPELTFLGSGGTVFASPNAKFFTCKNNTVTNLKITGTTGTKAFVGLNIVPTGGTANADNCQGNTVQNIELNSNGGNGTLYGIYVSSAPIYDLDIKNNVVKNLTCQSTTATYTNTIYGISMNFGTFSINITTTSGSTAATLASASLSSGVTYTIVNNANIPNGTTFTYSGSTAITLSAPATGTASAIASTLSSIDINCIGNEISNLSAGNAGSSANNVIVGLMSGGCSNIFEKNLVYNLNTISSGTGSLIKAMRFANSKIDGITVKNNIIRLGTDVTSNAEISAIIDEGLSSNGHPFNIYHNTIYIGGTSSTKPSHCFNHSSGANYGLISLKNNIFSNVRSGSAYNQVYNLLGANEIYSSEYNLYQYGSRFATTPDTQISLGDWNILHLDFETGSKDQQDPKFTDAIATIPDMHLTSGTPADAAGLNLSALVADDFYANDRSVLSPHDLGAVAYAISTETVTPMNKNLVYAADGNIILNNLSGKTASVYSFSGQLLKSVKLTSDFVTIPVAKGLYLVSVNGEVTKVVLK